MHKYLYISNHMYHPATWNMVIGHQTAHLQTLVRCNIER